MVWVQIPSREEQKFDSSLNAKVNAASKEVDGEKSEEEQVPEDVELKKTGKEISNRDRRVVILLL
jgi:hypothetical protein